MGNNLNALFFSLFFQKAFIDDIFNNHITIYLSTHFLAEVYQNVLANNFLQSLYESHSIKEFNKIPLIKFLHG